MGAAIAVGDDAVRHEPAKDLAEAAGRDPDVGAGALLAFGVPLVVRDNSSDFRRVEFPIPFRRKKKIKKKNKTKITTDFTWETTSVIPGETPGWSIPRQKRRTMAPA